MTEQTDKLRRALRGCAERGITPTAEPWTEISARLEDREAAPAPRRLVPRGRPRLVLAAALVLLFGMGAYAGSGMLYEIFRDELPGARGPVYGEKLNLEQSSDGVRVTLEWAYADAGNVVVGYNVEDLKKGRRVAGQPAELAPSFVEDEDNISERRADRLGLVELTDESGRDFDGSGGGTSGLAGVAPLTETAHANVFEPEGNIEPGGKHRFRLSIPVEAVALPARDRSMPETPVGEPFVFDFEIPVRPAPTVQVNQEVEANGVTLTLKRVVDSPTRPHAVFCLEDPPLDDHYWFPTDEDPADAGLVHKGGPVAPEDQCAEVLLADRLEGRSSLTVTEVEGMPQDPDEQSHKKIQGPWTFEFEVPEGGAR